MQCHPSWSVRDHSCLEYSWLMQNNVKEISLYFSWVVGNEESCPGSSVLSTGFDHRLSPERVRSVSDVHSQRIE